MKTQIELQNMTIASLRKEAQTLKVKNYSRLDRAVLVMRILEAQELVTENDEFTDRDGKVITISDQVKAFIGKKEFSGVISGVKIIEDEQYVHVMLDGQEKSKMFHTGDVKFVSHKREENTPVIIKEANGRSTYIAGEVSGVNKDEATSGVKSRSEKTSSNVPQSTSDVTVTAKKREVKHREVPGFTKEQQETVTEEILRYQNGEISKKELVIALMESGITKQQIDRYVDPKILHWSYVYDIYRAHGK